jgi:PAS domain S-box-containing protein
VNTALSSAWRWVFVLAIGILFVCGIQVFTRLERLASATDRVNHTYEVILISNSLDYILRNIEETLAENALPLTPLLKNELLEKIARANRICEKLETLVKNNAFQAKKLSHITLLLDTTRNKLEQENVIAGNHIVFISRNLVEDFKATEDELLAARTRAVDEAGEASKIFVASSIAIALALSIAALLVNHQFMRRNQLLDNEISSRVALQAQHVVSEGVNKSILDSTGDSIFILDTNGVISSINRPGMRLWELNEEQGEAPLTGKKWEPLWEGDHNAEASEALRLALNGMEARFQAEAKTLKGHSRWWDVIMTPVLSSTGETVSVVSIAREISQLKEVALERERLLAHERVARSEAERAARIKDEFVITLSHELRTPLNAILGWTQVLKKKEDLNQETLQKALDVIERNSRAQAKMVDDLLDMSRILSGKLRLDIVSVDMNEVVGAAIESIQPTADVKGVKLTKILSSVGSIQGDPARLQQVLWNLLSNALKFTPRDGLVQVVLRSVGSQVEITVADTGQGIDEMFLPAVFERFRQGDGTITRKFGGLGLGLSIAKNILEMHGGTISVNSPGLGKGTTFTVRLPLMVVAFENENQQDKFIPVTEKNRNLANSLQGLNVLVLDDEPDARDLVQEVLSECGAIVTTAASAEEAIKLIDEHNVNPDVILSDIGMPMVDGYEFIRRIRARDDDLKRVPAAALTALARLEDRRRALFSGFQTHIAKPVDPSELIAVVASLSGRTIGEV